jgi:hypothetical protein
MAAVRVLVPAALLTIVAGAQIALSRHAALTPWKGGGFGMFSTLDHGAFRGVSVIVDGPERSETLAIPPSLENLAARVANFPDQWLLRRLADGVAAREARYGRPVTRITLHVWKTSFARDTLHATEHRLRTFVRASDQPASEPPVDPGS